MHNNRLKILLFVYNFKHKKSVDFIKKLYENNFKIDVIVAAKLKEIKRLTDEYNMMRMIVRSYNEQVNILEMRITELMSSIDN